NLSGEGQFVFLKPGGLIAAAPPPTTEPPLPTVTKEVVREYGTLAVQGRLSGIEVWLDDQKVGETGTGTALVLNNVAAGAHRMKARKAGHKDWEREVHVAARQRAEVVIDIEPLSQEPPPAAKSEYGAEMVLVPAGEFSMGSDDETVARTLKPCVGFGRPETVREDIITS